MTWLHTRKPGVGALCALLLVACGQTAGGDDVLPPAAGSAAADYLRHEVYTQVTLEVDMVGQVVTTEIMQELVLKEIRHLLGKPGDVNLVFQAPDPAAVQPPGGWTLEDIESVEGQHRSEWTGEDTAVLYLLYLPGAWHGSTPEHQILGLAYGPSQMVIFPDSVAAVCTPGKANIEDPEARDLLCPLTEAAVWIHELGHLVGLVDAGVPMVNDHEDPEHPYHCHDVGCIMHWSHESGDLATYIEKRLQQGNLTLNVFGEDCAADLEAFAAGE